MMTTSCLLKKLKLKKRTSLPLWTKFHSSFLLLHALFQLPLPCIAGISEGMMNEAVAVVEEAEIDRLPIDLLAHIFYMIPSFTDLAQASAVCRRWKLGVKLSYGRREKLRLAGCKMDDDATVRIVRYAHALKELDIPRSRWACQITDRGLSGISSAKCIGNLKFISLWGMTGITDSGIVQLVSRSSSLRHLNIGGTFITDDSLFAIAKSCPQLKTIGLWCCRHVTPAGLIVLVGKCPKLKSINVWGSRIPPYCITDLINIRPGLEIKS